MSSESLDPMAPSYLPQSDPEAYEKKSSRSPELFPTSSERDVTLEEIMALSNPQTSSIPENEKVEVLGQYSYLSRKYEHVALQTALQANFGYISLSTAKKCLDVYWSWCHPTHLSIYRPAFFRDMATHSPTNPFDQNCCYSPALLSMIFSDTISLVYGSSEMGKIIEQHSHTLLMQEILFPATVATVTAALHRAIKSMHENNTSITWIFSGISNRLAQDLDLFERPQFINPPLAIQNVEARTRLAWSVFYWDNIFSLYLGRLPSIGQPFSTAGCILDYSSDSELWDPILVLKGDTSRGIELNRTQKHRAPQQQSFFHKAHRFPSRSIDSKGKSNSPGISSVKTLNTSSMQVKFSILALVSGFIERLYGHRNASLVSEKFSLTSSEYLKADPKDLAIQSKVYLRELTDFWNLTSSDLKFFDPLSHQPSSSINPATLSNNLVYNSSLLIALVPLLQTDNIIDIQEINLGISACQNTIEIISLYISSFGKFNLNFWHEYSPYLASQYLLALLKQNLPSDRRSDILHHLQTLLKILRRPQFQLPNILQLQQEIEKYLKDTIPAHEHITSYKSLDFAGPSNLQIPKNYDPIDNTASHLDHNTQFSVTHQLPFNSMSTGSEHLVQYKPNFMMQSALPQLPGVELAQGNMIRPYNHGHAIAQDTRMSNYFLESQGIPQQYTAQMDMSQMPHRIINPNTQYTLSRVPEMSDMFSAGMPNLLGQFSPSNTSIATPSTTTASSDQENHFNHQMGGQHKLHTSMLLHGQDQQKTPTPSSQHQTPETQ